MTNVEAETLVGRIDPDSPPPALVLNDQGVHLGRAGRIEEAIGCFRRALELTPEFPEAHNNLAINLAVQGCVEEAVASYQEAIRLRPDYPEAHNNLGITLARSGRIEEAVAQFERAVACKADYPEAHNNLANALRNQGRIDEAVSQYRAALELRPRYPEAHNNLANALAELGRDEEALGHYEEAIRLNPRYAEAHNNLANALATLGGSDEAEQGYHRALWHNPDYAEAHNNLGNNLAEKGRLAEAVACYRQALSLNPEYAEAWNNLGISLNKQGKHGEAEDAYAEALRFKPDYPDAHLNRALGWLASGNFEQGWAEYEWRWECPGINRAPFPQPAWAGESLKGRTIVLYYEQGLGDTLQFVRYAPLVKRRGGTVVVDCQPQLASLLSRCPGIDRLVPRGEPLPEFHVHCALMSLPRIFHTTLADVPSRVPYLYADPRLVAQWRRRLEPVQGFRIGVNWQGSKHYKGDRHRSFAIDHFAALAEVPGAKLVSLQKGPAESQLAAFSEKHEVLSFGDELDEGKGAFEDTAAVMMNLDLVVTSDTSIAHLAGGLGVPVWIPLSWSADWRWLEHREDCPWYPTMRLFRQVHPGDWPEVFRRMADNVRDIASKPVDRNPFVVETSAGELLDKITILEIKAERIADDAKLRHVQAELAVLRAVADMELTPGGELTSLTAELRLLNERLWDSVDAIHACEASGDFGDEFIRLARSIYLDNDLRAEAKRKINELLDSPLVEIKHYSIQSKLTY